MAFPPLDIDVPAATLHLLSVFLNFVQQTCGTGFGKRSILSSRIVDDLFDPFCDHSIYCP